MLFVIYMRLASLEAVRQSMQNPLVRLTQLRHAAWHHYFGGARVMASDNLVKPIGRKRRTRRL